MNVLNRTWIVGALLATLAGVTAACLFPDFVIEQVVLVADWLAQVQPRIELVDRLILIAVAAAADLLLILLIIAELRHWGTQQVRIQRVEGGSVTLTLDSVRQRIAFYVDGVPGVVNVSPKVKIKGDQVGVSVDVLTAAGIHVPAKAQEIISVIRTVVEETMGLVLLREPEVTIRTATFQGISAPPAAELLPPPVSRASQPSPRPSSEPSSGPSSEPSAGPSSELSAGPSTEPLNGD
jgi:hypothetical protein